MSKLTNDKKRELAERFFIYDGKTQKWIAEYLELTEATVSRWKAGRKEETDWDTRRAHVLSAPHKIRELTVNAMLEVAKGEKPSIDADALVKLATTVQKMDKQIGLQVTISVLMQLDKFIANEAPALAGDYYKLHQKFVHLKAQEI